MARFLEQLRYVPIKKGAIFILPEAANKQKNTHPRVGSHEKVKNRNPTNWIENASRVMILKNEEMGKGNEYLSGTGEKWCHREALWAEAKWGWWKHI